MVAAVAVGPGCLTREDMREASRKRASAAGGAGQDQSGDRGPVGGHKGRPAADHQMDSDADPGLAERTQFWRNEANYRFSGNTNNRLDKSSRPRSQSGAGSGGHP